MEAEVEEEKEEEEKEEEEEEEEKEKEEEVLDCWQEDSLQPCNSKPHLPMLMPKPPDNSLKSSLVIISKQTTLLKKSKDISEPTCRDSLLYGKQRATTRA